MINQDAPAPTERQITTAIGQYLYQSIKEEWLTAYMTLSCLGTHSQSETLNKTFVCTAYYTSAFHPEQGAKVEDKMIETNDEIKGQFERLFFMAQTTLGKQLTEGTFSIDRSGDFNLKFIEDTSFDDE